MITIESATTETQKYDYAGLKVLEQQKKMLQSNAAEVPMSFERASGIKKLQNVNDFHKKSF